MTSLANFSITAGLGLILYQWYSFHQLRSKLSHIPTVGSNNFIWAFFSALRYLIDKNNVLEEGYAKYGGSFFKFPATTTKSGWMIVVSDQHMIEEIRKAPSDVLSFTTNVKDLLATELLLGTRHAGIPEYQSGIVRSSLTRALPDRFADVHDEIVHASGVFLPKGNGWEAGKALETCIHIVCRTSSRLFVGLPLCRNEEYCKIQEKWTINFVIGGHIIHLAPAILQPVVSFFVSKLLSSRKRVEDFIRPMVKGRLENDAKYGVNWTEKPNDAISWLLDEAPEGYRTVEDVTTRLMLINMAAIHTTSISLANALIDLAARPKYIKPLREEVEEVVGEYGWTKEAMERLRKVDSFLKESARLSGLVSTSLTKQACKDFVFSNGVVIPQGCTIGAGTNRVHIQPDIYENPNTFDGFRFYDTSKSEGGASNQMVSIDSKFLFFGLGRNACPGRFFAVNELKLAMSHILLNYDIKLPGDATEVPAGQWFAASRTPSPTAQILFRKRTPE